MSQVPEKEEIELPEPRINHLEKRSKLELIDIIGVLSEEVKRKEK